MTNKYTASQIISRAKDLADIQNTDFLSYEEQKRYLNDAWTTVYQSLINKGDNQFVKEAELMSIGNSEGYTDYEIPSDLFQINNIRDTRGFLFTRKAISESDSSSGTYDIINNKIRIYGSHYNKVILTYWMTPTYLSFPNKDIEWDNSNSIIDYCNNSILLSNGDIYNVVTQSLIATITLKEDCEYKLGNGYYIEKEENYSIYSFNGELLNEITLPIDVSIYFIKDRSGAIFYQFLSDSKYSNPKSIITNDDLLIIDEYESDGYPLYITSDYNRGYWVYYNESTKSIIIYKEEDESELEIDTSSFNPTTISWADDFDNKPTFYITNKKNELYIIAFEGKSIEYDKLQLRPSIIKALLRYGPLTSDGTFMTLKSIIPNTDLNFPNNLYFSLLACDLALRYVMKMNADSSGLDNLYQNMWNELKNQLDQSGSYTRIKNVY